MGQYYKVALKIGSEKTGIYENDSYRKLTEFSWCNNSFSDFIASRLFKNKGRVAWVGDYSEIRDDDDHDTEQKNINFLCRNGILTKGRINSLYRSAWQTERTNKWQVVDFDFKGKFILNHDKRQFLDCDKYLQNSQDKDGWILSPLAMLTAIGNGKGGGDFYSDDSEMVDNIGIWAWNELEIVDCNPSENKEAYPTWREVEFKFIERA